jgi:hypothetical protein
MPAKHCCLAEPALLLPLSPTTLPCSVREAEHRRAEPRTLGASSASGGFLIQLPGQEKIEMTAHIMAGAAALALVLGTGVASATSIGSGSNSSYEQNRQQLQTEPGYSVGTGAAHIGDGSDPGYLAQQHALRSMPGVGATEGL